MGCQRGVVVRPALGGYLTEPDVDFFPAPFPRRLNFMSRDVNSQIFTFNISKKYSFEK